MSNEENNSNMPEAEAGDEENNSNMPEAGDAPPNEDPLAVLMNALKAKLKKQAAKHVNMLENLSESVWNRVQVLREMQGQHDELGAKCSAEIAELENKFQKLYEPLYAKRCNVVNGVDEKAEENPEEAVAMEQGDDKDAEEKGVPEFWLTAMKNNKLVNQEISKRDKEVLKYLKDIKWGKIEEGKGFKLEFYFETNPFFKDTVLIKTYQMIDADEIILDKATGMEIDWYPKKEKFMRKKGSKKGSFFINFFNPPQIPGDDDEIDEYIADELEKQILQDYCIGSEIKDKIIHRAVSWFTGDAKLEEEEEEEEDEEEEKEEKKEDDNEEEGKEDDGEEKQSGEEEEKEEKKDAAEEESKEESSAAEKKSIDEEEKKDGGEEESKEESSAAEKNSSEE
ncbi:Nucleosome assembly protein (NAP) [Corchorus olitorius]|uniref:Nucleosome assembly protein (NAP) n=1 Tax=Corchorus olitorius TaxID=93759 RepID=A0A1R3IGB7_9ROSI|nr:Nucleosome assembly protein (NAP) [Corchorus olitorius]